jgi:predicted transcriptional regulator
MSDDDEHDRWSEDEDTQDEEALEVQKMLAAVDLLAKKAMRYLELEGFVERTDTPGVYKYTPEGLVLARKQYKEMKDQGLL